MTATKEHDLERCAEGGPQSAMERRFLEEFLETRGHSLASLKSLPEEEARRLMTEASPLRLAEAGSGGIEGPLPGINPRPD